MICAIETDFYREMVLIRKVEQTLLDLFSKGLLNGTVHTCIGQEACAVGTIAAADKTRDIVFSNHRGHGHYIAYCGDVKGLIAEIMGLPSGVCGGIGGSQHLQRDNFYTNGIQGAGAPIVVGMALAEQRKKSGAVCIAFLGDGTLGEGAVYEAFNLAALWELPVLFVVEHNRYAQSTPFELQHAGDIARRAEPFGIPVHRIDGMDVRLVYAETAAILSRVRSGQGPALLLLDTYRFAAHSKGDDNRDAAEIAGFMTRDPLKLIEHVVGAEECVLASERAGAVVAQILLELRVA